MRLVDVGARIQAVEVVSMSRSHASKHRPRCKLCHPEKHGATGQERHGRLGVAKPNVRRKAQPTKFEELVEEAFRVHDASMRALAGSGDDGDG